MGVAVPVLDLPLDITMAQYGAIYKNAINLIKMRNFITLILLFTSLITSAQVTSTLEVEINNDGIVLPRVAKSDKMMLTPEEGQIIY